MGNTCTKPQRVPFFSAVLRWQCSTSSCTSLNLSDSLCEVWVKVPRQLPPQHPSPCRIPLDKLLGGPIVLISEICLDAVPNTPLTCVLPLLADCVHRHKPGYVIKVILCCTNKLVCAKSYAQSSEQCKSTQYRSTTTSINDRSVPHAPEMSNPVPLVERQARQHTLEHLGWYIING